MAASRRLARSSAICCPCVYGPAMQQIVVVLPRGVYRDGFPVWVNRVDPAMSVTCPLYLRLLSNWCGAAKRRDVPEAELEPDTKAERIISSKALSRPRALSPLTQLRSGRLRSDRRCYNQ